MTIPFLDLKRAHQPLRDEIEAALRRVLDSGQFILGDEVRVLEESVARLCGVEHAVAVASGTDALYLALRALGIGEGHQVVTSPFTFIATGTSIVRAGARPVFADIDPATFNLDPGAAEAALTGSTRALLPVDLYGSCAAWERFEGLAARRDLLLVEDAAQSIGASRRGRKAGSFGDAAAISFYPTKNLGGMGDSGILTTRREGVAKRARLLRAHGDAGGYDHTLVGINSRMDAFQAAVLNVKLARLERWNRERAEQAALYSALLGESLGGGALAEGAAVELPRAGDEDGSVWHQYVIRARERDELARFLKGRGIGCGVYYPVPLHLQTCFQDLGLKPGAFPEAERASREVLALPVYPGLTRREVTRVCRTIAGYYGGGGS